MPPFPTRRRTWLAGLVVATAATALPAAYAATAPSPAPARPAAAAAPTVPVIKWKPCQGEGGASRTAQCAMVQVPLDYDQPRGKKIGLSVLRVRAANPKRRIGTLFVNPGGPGGSGVQMAANVGPYLPAEVRARFDIVGFDPRGVAGSTPLRCFMTEAELRAADRPFVYPTNIAERTQVRRLDVAIGRLCAKNGGDILNHMSTADVARDMDLLRAAVGDPKLTYLGFSYGSMLGSTYAALFPTRVRAMVLDGVLDPLAWSTGRRSDGFAPFTTRIRSDRGSAATLREFFRLCDQAGSRCAFSGDAAGKYQRMLAALPDQPDGQLPTKGQVTSFVLSALYSAQAWPMLADMLASLDQAVNGGTVGAAEKAEVRKSMRALASSVGVKRDDYANGRYSNGRYSNGMDTFYGVGCSDSRNSAYFSAWHVSAEASAARYGEFGRLWTWLSSACRSWPKTAGQDRYLGPWSTTTSTPVLVVGNSFDPSTPHHGARVAHQALRNSRLLTYAGWGHTAYLGGNPCVDSTVTEYLVRRRSPVSGKVCQPVGSPFDVKARRTAASGGNVATLKSSFIPAPVRQVLAEQQ